MTGNREMYKVFTPFKMPLSAACVKGCRSAWRRRNRASQPPDRPRRCLRSTIRKRRSTPICSRRMKNGAGSIARVLSAAGGRLRPAARFSGDRGNQQAIAVSRGRRTVAAPVPASLVTGAARRTGWRSGRKLAERDYLARVLSSSDGLLSETV